MTTKSRTRFGAVVATALAAVLALAGCAQDGAADNGGDSGDPMSLNVGQISDSVAFFPLYVAETEGYFEEEGLTLGDRPRLGTGAKLAAALESGSIDLAAGVMTDAFNHAEHRGGTKLVSALVNAYYVDIIVGKDADVAPRDGSLEEKIRSLEGKQIGITGPGSGTEALVIYLLKQVGLDPSTDAELVNLGAEVPAAIGALKSGRVDALSFFQPVGQIAEAEGVGDIYISPARGDIPAMRGEVHGAVFTRQSVIDAKPEAVQAFNRAIVKAEETINGDPARVLELLQGYQETADQDTLEALVPVLQEEIPEEPSFSVDSYQTAVDFHVETGLISTPPEFEEFVYQP
ncbi:MAG: ABC transporter substrate-binding protein [Propionibacteriales bacterium]|nr:ABC transporter substrate-binding protein [Propionibacteriales bacterium]